MVFGISNNNVCISLKNHKWLPQFLAKYEAGPAGMKVFRCNGNDIFGVYGASNAAFAYARKYSRPAIVVYDDLVRRFGHAATDRQAAYYTAKEIQQRQDYSALLDTCAELVALGVYTAEELQAETNRLVDLIEQSFDVAVNEPKITSNDLLVESNSQPLTPIPTPTSSVGSVRSLATLGPVRLPSASSREKVENMRKHMTRFYDELLCTQRDVVYIGEDVQHGGYYLVTDGLAEKHPRRVIDFPPDETSLLGVGMGLSQAGMTPIVEIPYAKYLDCAADMFHEAVIMNWLSDGSQPNGMLLRLQGFDKGVFGGNFHTHNTIYIPAGLDVVCYSNGFDYVRGVRYCMRQARAGRMVMSVDSTDLLNRRHVGTKDDGCLSHYPAVSDEDAAEMSFDDIVVYTAAPAAVADTVDAAATIQTQQSLLNDVRSGVRKIKAVVVSYGNGVPTSLLAVKNLLGEGGSNNDCAVGLARLDEVLVVDCPYLSAVPAQLTEVLTAVRSQNSDFSLVLADVCKESGNMPLHQYVLSLQRARLLPRRWSIIGAANTYNPLSRTGTFLSEEGISAALLELLREDA